MRGRWRAARRATLLLGAIALAVIWVRLAARPSSDLLNHREFGRRFIAGTFLYEGGLDYPYLPAWAAAHAPLAAVPASLVSAVVFPFGVAALGAILWILHRLSRDHLPLDGTAEFWVAAAAVALTSRFVIRDLLDGGENLMLCALAWSALYAWHQQRPWIGAWLLGAAIALKLTAAIFVVVLLVLRERGLAARAIAAAAILTVLPLLRFGADGAMHHLQRWADGIGRGLASGDPSVGVLGPEPLGNLALRAGLGRLLIAADSSAGWRTVASWIAVAAAIGLLALLVRALSRRGADAGLGRTHAWAAAGVLALLLSPITWRAHLVGILPACYLLIRQWAFDRRLSAMGIIGLVAVAVPGLIVARGVMGTAVSEWADRWSLTTAALVCLTIGVTKWPARR